jgi:hypothetical protein
LLTVKRSFRKINRRGKELPQNKGKCLSKSLIFRTLAYIFVSISWTIDHGYIRCLKQKLDSVVGLRSIGQCFNHTSISQVPHRSRDLPTN